MSTIRVNKTKGFTVMSNQHLRDKNLSLKAKGLMSVMLSLPDDWNYSIGGLVSISLESETAIKSTLNELKRNGYLVVTKLPPSKTESGRFEYIYDVYEHPIIQPVENQPLEKQGVEKQGVEILLLENLAVENPPVYKSTNQLNTDVLNTDKRNKEYRAAKAARSATPRFTPPSLDDVKAYCLERHNDVDPERFVDFYASKGWMVGKNKMKDWKAAVRNWERGSNSEVKKEEKHDVKTDGFHGWHAHNRLDDFDCD